MQDPYLTRHLDQRPLKPEQAEIESAPCQTFVDIEEQIPGGWKIFLTSNASCFTPDEARRIANAILERVAWIEKLSNPSYVFDTETPRETTEIAREMLR